MELVGKIFDTLGITQLALLQMALVVALVFILSAVLIRPILATFRERENRSVKPVEEARLLLADVEGKTAQYEDSLRKSAAEALAAKRRKMEEATRAERKEVEAVIEECNLQVEEMRGRIAAEKSETSRALRAEVSLLAAEIAGKVLGRPAT